MSREVRFMRAGDYFPHFVIMMSIAMLFARLQALTAMISFLFDGTLCPGQ